MAGDIELCAGAGGWSLAARDLGLDALGIELDPVICETRRAAGLDTVQGDVSTFRPEGFGEVRGLIASPPCQSFSRGGKKEGYATMDEYLLGVYRMSEGQDPRLETMHPGSRLVLEPMRWVMATSPAWVVCEQVPQVLPVWQMMAARLRLHGYETWAGHLRAEQYGVPQVRRRAIFIARREGRVVPPRPTHSRYYERDPERLDVGVRSWVSMAAALGWPEDLLLGLPRVGDERGPQTEDGYRARDLRPVTRPASSVTEKARSWTLRRPAPTVGTTRGGVAGRQAQGHINLTISEAAILQTFPADHPFHGNRTKVFEQVGNAVPVKMARRILETVTA